MVYFQTASLKYEPLFNGTPEGTNQKFLSLRYSFTSVRTGIRKRIYKVNANNINSATEVLFSAVNNFKLIKWRLFIGTDLKA
jgi:hypothetical protein